MPEKSYHCLLPDWEEILQMRDWVCDDEPYNKKFLSMMVVIAEDNPRRIAPAGLSALLQF